MNVNEGGTAFKYYLKLSENVWLHGSYVLKEYIITMFFLNGYSIKLPYWKKVSSGHDRVIVLMYF